MKLPSLGVKSELQLLVYTIAAAMQDPSHILDLHHSSWQCQIPDILSEARDWTCIFLDTSQIPFCCATGGTSKSYTVHYFPWSHRFSSFIYFKSFIVVDLQGCDNFWCTTKWFSHTYPHIHSHSDSFPTEIITEYWVECSVQVPIGQLFHILQCTYASPKPPIHPSHPLKLFISLELIFFWIMIFIFYIIVGLQYFVNFLLYSKVAQSHIHIYILSLTLSSKMLHHKWLDIVPSAIHQNFIAHPFQRQ